MEEEEIRKVKLSQQKHSGCHHMSLKGSRYHHKSKGNHAKNVALHESKKKKKKEDKRNSQPFGGKCKH